MFNNNNNNPICKAPECQKTSVALSYKSPYATHTPLQPPAWQNLASRNSNVYDSSPPYHICHSEVPNHFASCTLLPYVRMSFPPYKRVWVKSAFQMIQVTTAVKHCYSSLKSAA